MILGNKVCNYAFPGFFFFFGTCEISYCYSNCLPAGIRGELKLDKKNSFLITEYAVIRLLKEALD
jgi:hypothetical protein